MVFDWSVGCYLYPGSHQCDSSVAILRGGGDHANLAREPWLQQFTWLSWKLGSVSYGRLSNKLWTLCYALPKKDNLHPEFESMSVSVRPGSRDSSKNNISWLRVDREETTFSGAGLSDEQD